MSSWSTPSLTVALACRWIDSGVVDDLEEQKRRDARHRQTLARRILRHSELMAHPSSYYFWLKLPEGLRADTVVADLARNGVMVTSAEPFATTEHVPHALRVAMGSIGMAALEQALEMLREVVEV